MSNLGKALYDEAYDKAYNEAYTKAEFKIQLNNIKNIVNSLKITPEQAMQALNIAKEDQQKYLSCLQHA